VNRREFVSLVGAGAGASALKLRSAPAGAPSSRGPRGRMVVGWQRSPTDDKALMFFKRHAVSHICGYPPGESDRGNWTPDSLMRAA
jgi:hypothetical protein